jgi:HEAT repeat protein
MNIADALKGGDRRSIGRANEVSEHVLTHPESLPELLDCLKAEDLLVRMRAGDALEKVSARCTALLQPQAGLLLTLGERVTDKETRWHLAQILPRLDLQGDQLKRAVAMMLDYADDPSRIVRADALTALVAFAQSDSALRRQVGTLLREAESSTAPAVQARARRLRRDHGWA